MGILREEKRKDGKDRIRKSIHRRNKVCMYGTMRGTEWKSKGILRERRG